MGKIRVLVASDYEMVRSGLRQLLTIDEAFDLLPTSADIGNGLPHLCQTLSPDVLLIEVATYSSSTLRIPANVLASVPHMRILVLSTIDKCCLCACDICDRCTRLHPQVCCQSELVQALKQVNRGRRFIDPRLDDSLFEYLLSPITTHATKPIKYLSRRESEVLRSIALGFTTREISKELKVSQKTVQTYRERIYKKLGLRSRADLVHYALARGLLGGEH